MRFVDKAEDCESRTKTLIDRFEQSIKEIVSVPRQERTYANTFEALEVAEEYYQTEENSITFPSSVSTCKALRDKSNEAQEKFSEYMINTYMREDLYLVFAEWVKDHPNYATELASPQQVRLVDKTIEGFEKNGLALPSDKRDKLKEIKTEISKLGIEFSKNVAEDTTKLSFSRQQLEGIPKDILDSLEKDGDNLFVTVKHPDVGNVAKYCSVSDTRRALDKAYASKCMAQNIPILESVLKLRYDAAQLLGKTSWSEVVTQYLMSKNSTNVTSFQKRMIDLLRPFGEKELETLIALKKSDYEARGLTGFDGRLNSYDYQFYNNLMLVRNFDVDNNLVKEYFPMEVVTAGLFKAYETLLGVRFEQQPQSSFPVWHEDVQLFSVTDQVSNQVIGYFFLDLFPREGKYTHFAVFPLQAGFARNGVSQLPVAAMVCNFTKSTETAPSLLTHDEVVTYFHEFGHVMHNMSSKVEYSKFAGTSVERDFVEAPSQLFEFWCWNATVLPTLSGHYKDNSKKLPTELLNKMLAAKNLNISLFYLRQLLFSTFDQRIHSCDTSAFGNTAATFGHMFGYDAGYYSYMWSEVFSADIFSKFEAGGVMNPELGMQLRQKVLSVGGSQDSSVTLNNFLGRDPEEVHFLKSIGYGVIGGIGNSATYITPISVLQKWFPDRKGLVGCLFFTIILLMSFVFRFPPPGFNPKKQKEVTEQGVIVMTESSVSNPLKSSTAIEILDRQEEVLEEMTEGKDIIETLKSLEFIQIFLIYMSSTIFNQVLTSRFSNLLQDVYLVSADFASSMVSVTGAFNLAGQLIFPLISDYFKRTRCIALIFTVKVMAIVMFTFVNRTQNVVGALVLGWTVFFGIGATYGLLPAVMSDIFGVRKISAVYGLLLSSLCISGVGGGLVFNAIYGHLLSKGYSIIESYNINIYWILVLTFAGWSLMWFVRYAPQDKFFPAIPGQIIRIRMFRRMIRLGKSTGLEILTKNQEAREWKEFITKKEEEMIYDGTLPSSTSNTPVESS
eukprot:gene14913-17633_t